MKLVHFKFSSLDWFWAVEHRRKYTQALLRTGLSYFVRILKRCSYQTYENFTPSITRVSQCFVKYRHMEFRSSITSMWHVYFRLIQNSYMFCNGLNREARKFSIEILWNLKKNSWYTITCLQAFFHQCKEITKVLFVPRSSDARAEDCRVPRSSLFVSSW